MASADNLCVQPSDMVQANKKTGNSIRGPGLVMPIMLVGAMTSWLVYVSAAMDKESAGGADPIRSVSIGYPLAALVLYPSIVYFGVKFMDSREPFEITKYVFVYNMYQCVLNGFVVGLMIWEFAHNSWYSMRYGFLPWGNRMQNGYAGFRMSWLVWLHYNNKYLELMDTMWMVLKKKNNQISFLHCYHHILLIWVWWHCCSTEPGGEAWFGACVNSLIHVYMYGYYTMSLLKWDVEFMKIYMTTCQLLQFVICLAHATFVGYQTLYGSDLKGYYPVVMCYDQAFVMINMLYLFGQFFYKSYIKNAKRSPRKVA